MPNYGSRLFIAVSEELRQVKLENKNYSILFSAAEINVC